MTEESCVLGDTQQTSRRDFLHAFTAVTALTGAGSLLLTGCKQESAMNLKPSDNRLQKLRDSGIDVEKHRAFLTLWLLLTTNFKWVNTMCTFSDFAGLSHDLGGHLSPTDIQSVFTLASKAQNQKALVSAGNVFNSDDFKKISGYDNAYYSDKTCPTTMAEAVSLYTPEASITVQDPQC
jgi:hypothetical protein